MNTKNKSIQKLVEGSDILASQDRERLLAIWPLLEQEAQERLTFIIHTILEDPKNVSKEVMAAFSFDLEVLYDKYHLTLQAQKRALDDFEADLDQIESMLDLENAIAA